MLLVPLAVISFYFTTPWTGPLFFHFAYLRSIIGLGFCLQFNWLVGWLVGWLAWLMLMHMGGLALACRIASMHLGCVFFHFSFRSLLRNRVATCPVSTSSSDTACSDKRFALVLYYVSTYPGSFTCIIST
jgi:hypothetical protein